MGLLRAIAAGLFVVVGVLATVAVIGALGGFDEQRPPFFGWIAQATLIVAATGLTIAAMRLFNPKGANAVMPQSESDALAELERLGLIVDAPFTATRAFGVDDYDDEGPHYFLQLADDAGILVLCGQYLYDYEPIDDDPDMHQPRQFPCTAFTVRRHRTEGYAVDVICPGDVIEPEVMAAGRTKKAWIRDGFLPEDGQVITDIGFDELMRARAGGPGPAPVGAR